MVELGADRPSLTVSRCADADPRRRTAMSTAPIPSDDGLDDYRVLLGEWLRNVPPTISFDLFRAVLRGIGESYLGHVQHHLKEELRRLNSSFEEMNRPIAERAEALRAERERYQEEDSEGSPGDPESEWCDPQAESYDPIDRARIAALFGTHPGTAWNWLNNPTHGVTVQDFAALLWLLGCPNTNIPPQDQQAAFYHGIATAMADLLKDFPNANDNTVNATMVSELMDPEGCEAAWDRHGRAVVAAFGAVMLAIYHSDTLRCGKVDPGESADVYVDQIIEYLARTRTAGLPAQT
jgi:hypothetical protein